MKKGILLTVTAVSIFTSVFILRKIYFTNNTLSENEQRALFVKERLQYEYDMVKDPATGRIPEDIRERELELAKVLPVKGVSPGFRTTNLNFYVPAGPTNIGGRTRAVEFDKRYNGTTNRVIMGGSVSGGIMRSIDGGASWSRVSPEGDIHNVTCFAQDPRPGFEDTWYAGTGEAIQNGGTGSFYFGYGIFKTTNNGATWTALTSTRSGSLYAFDNSFDLINRIAVNPANGDVFVACVGSIIRSQNGGETWATVKGSQAGTTATGNTDVVINSTGTKILVAFHLRNTTERGVWQSPTGDAGSWTLLGGNVDDAPVGWKVNNTTATWGRILIELAPSNQNILYVFYENGKSQAPPTLVPEADLFKCDLSTTTWTNLSPNLPDVPGRNQVGSDPLAVQGGYDMLLKIKPDNANVVFIGGTNLYRSNDGFASNSNTAWIGGYSSTNTNPNSYPPYPNSHPDMHNLAFDPSNVNRAICANDGGLQVTNDITTSSILWSNINNYQTLQYYYVAIDPIIGNNNFLGGAQDNGTTFRDSTLVLGARPSSRPNLNDHEKTNSGDGVSVGISNFHNGSQYIYEGVQQGPITRDNLTNYHTTIGKDIRPAQSLLTATPGGGFGEFVTKFSLSPDNTETLFYVNYNKLFRTNAASTVDSTTWERLTGVETTVNAANPTGTNISIRSLGFSRGPYLSSHALYMGTTNAKIYRLDNYQLSLASNIPVDITPIGMSGSVQDIAVNPNDDNEVMAVVSNYSVVSIWWTNNAKSPIPTWYNAEGNLSLPSIRSCMIVPKKDAAGVAITEYYVGTSIGLYSAINIGVGAVVGSPIQTVWVREGGNILNYAVVQSLSYRPADNVLLVGTHGNGMYFSNIGSPNFLPNVITGINTPIRNDKNFISKTYPTLTSGSTINFQVGNMFAVKQLQIEVMNIVGQRVYQAVKPYQNGAVNINGLSPGTYILNITSSDRKNQFIQKFVKQ
ncbi:MAG TPA: T9SS type A sorting domain-containing protein [Segetibacter sp.]